MKLLACATLLLALPLSLLAYSKDPDSGLYFNDTKYTLGAPPDAALHHGMQSALLVHPEDLPERAHYSNSSMARVWVHVVAPGGGAKPHRVEDFREQVFIVLAGAVDFTVEGERLAAAASDVGFIPPGPERSYVARGDQPAKVLQAEFVQKGPRPEKRGRAFVTSERVRELKHTGGEGYVTVAPNARQLVNPLSIVSYGASHINASNALLLYHADIAAPRPFTANTVLARMGLSAYHPGGGTRWHFHADREQLFVILAGKGLVEIGGNTIEVKAGDLVFAPRHVGHGYKTTGAEPLKFYEVEWGRN
ncbi:MAG: cupin domain-containing protein [Opitutaceae bacterium]|nr:cupin domain-containing protein [Opitutaceae bacterium]